MANVKLSAIASAGAIVGADTIIGVQGGTTDVQYSVTNMAAAVVSVFGSSGTGNLARVTSPTFVTPTLGAATATTINGFAVNATPILTSVTIGGGGSITSSGAGGVLGSNAFTSTAYAPLASPTFTGTVTMPDASTFGANFAVAGNAILTAPTAGSLQHGGADVDTNAGIVAQVIRTQGALAGGTTNQAGKNLTIIVSPGKGTGVGGSLIIQTTPAGSTGTVVGTPTTALTIDSTQKTTLAGILTLPATGTSAATTLNFGTAGSGIYALAANQQEWSLGGTAQLNIQSGFFWFKSTNAVRIAIGLSADTFLTRPAAATLQLGDTNSATAAVAQSLVAGGSSGNSAAAALFTIAGSDQSGTTTIGGGIKIRGGNGTSAGGTVELWTSATTTPAVALSVSAAGNTSIASGKSFQLGNAATTGLTAGVLSALTNASIVILDSTGQAYRVPCII